MDHRATANCWERNAVAWTALARQGWDIYRDAVNTPGFFAMLPDVTGLHGLDAGCGEGYNTRLLADAGARMVALDVASTFVGYAVETEREEPAGIEYLTASALDLPFGAAAFDFVTAFMSLMDIGDPARVLREIYRVLRPGGFLQFSISHPCFTPPHRRLLRNDEGEAYAVEVGRYYERVEGRIDKWSFSAAPAQARAGLDPFEIPRFHWTLSEWLNAVVEAGFTIEKVGEPRADEETAERMPNVADTRVVAYFLHVRGRKGA